MRTMCQVLVKTRPASETWFIKITRQEKFRHLPADLFRKFMRNHIRIPLMVLTMYNCNFHSIVSFPVISLLSTLCIPALTILHDLPHQQLCIEGLGDMFIHSCFPGLLTVLVKRLYSATFLSTVFSYSDIWRFKKAYADFSSLYSFSPCSISISPCFFYFCILFPVNLQHQIF